MGCWYTFASGQSVSYYVCLCLSFVDRNLSVCIWTSENICPCRDLGVCTLKLSIDRNSITERAEKLFDKADMRIFVFDLHECKYVHSDICKYVCVGRGKFERNLKTVTFIQVAPLSQMPLKPTLLLNLVLSRKCFIHMEHRLSHQSHINSWEKLPSLDASCSTENWISRDLEVKLKCNCCSSVSQQNRLESAGGRSRSEAACGKMENLLCICG